MSERDTGWRFIAILTLAFVVIVGTVARARDDGRYAQVDPALKRWIEALRDRQGRGCCDTADGVRIEDPDWECDERRCRVKLDGAWHDVPDDALLPGPNRLGYPIVWRLYENGKPVIRCFLRGSQS